MEIHRTMWKHEVLRQYSRNADGVVAGCSRGFWGALLGRCGGGALFLAAPGVPWGAFLRCSWLASSWGAPGVLWGSLKGALGSSWVAPGGDFW